MRAKDDLAKALLQEYEALPKSGEGNKFCRLRACSRRWFAHRSGHGSRCVCVTFLTRNLRSAALRSAYTRRLLELSKNMEKQKRDIKSILDDSRNIQVHPTHPANYTRPSHSRLPPSTLHPPLNTQVRQSCTGAGAGYGVPVWGIWYPSSPASLLPLTLHGCRRT